LGCAGTVHDRRSLEVTLGVSSVGIADAPATFTSLLTNTNRHD
jgi:hypothetical protein